MLQSDTGSGMPTNMKDTTVTTASLAEIVASLSPRRVLTLNEFAHRLHSETSRARRFRLKLCCLLLSIPGYNEMVAQHGDSAVEAMMQDIGQVLVTFLRESDVVCRYALDAFAILLTHARVGYVAEVAYRIIAVLKKRSFRCGRKSIRVVPCIGMAKFPTSLKDSPSDFMHAAESALYTAEQEGPGSVVEPALI